MRPLIVFSLISVLLLTFYIREGEAGPIHAVRSGVTTITSPVRFVGSAVAAPFNAIGNVFSNLTASQESLDDLKKQNEVLTSKVAELSERLGGLQSELDAQTEEWAAAAEELERLEDQD